MTRDEAIEKATKAVEAMFVQARDTSFENMVKSGMTSERAEELLAEMDQHNKEILAKGLAEVRALIERVFKEPS